MNRRKWLKNSVTSASAVAFSAYAPYVLFDRRIHLPNETSYLRLNWNENPYGPSPQAVEAGKKAMIEANFYPDDHIEALEDALAKKFKLIPNQVMVTAGSTEVLGLLGQHAGLQSKDILTSEQSFPTIAIFGERCGAGIRMIPTDQDERLDLIRILKSIDRKTGIVFICNPNNPTSTDHNRADLEDFVKKVPGDVLICVDEAYIQFSRNGEAGSLTDMLSTHTNLIICRTFSKVFGLAGLRIGYALGNSSLISELRTRIPGFGMENSNIGVIAALASLEDHDHLSMVIRKNNESKEIVQQAFDRWGVSYAHSATNFIYAKSNRFVPNVREQLVKDNILITKWPTMTNHIRISMGKPEWMEKFVQSAKKYLV